MNDCIVVFNMQPIRMPQLMSLEVYNIKCGLKS